MKKELSEEFKPVTIDGKIFEEQKSAEEFKSFFNYFRQRFTCRICHPNILNFLSNGKIIYHSFWFMGRGDENTLVLEYLRLRNGIPEKAVDCSKFSDYGWNLIIYYGENSSDKYESNHNVHIITDKKLREDLKDIMAAIPPVVAMSKRI